MSDSTTDQAKAFIRAGHPKSALTVILASHLLRTRNLLTTAALITAVVKAGHGV